ncbi:MAG: phosphotransferase [Phycisphaerae bacterium]|jgi:homoserine kinase type II|nr:phosphotransferase [Phycisphaerae bacterium]
MAKVHATFEAELLATCLSHYDLGIIKGIRKFPAGSRRAPKVIIKSEKGTFLFKRRAHGRDHQAKVAFTHQLQLHLAAQNFPLPHLVGTRDTNNSMLIHEDHVYEMFEFIKGKGYDASLDATFNSGRILGLYHKLLSDFQSDYTPPTGSYHDAGAIHQAIGKTVGSLPIDSRPTGDEVPTTVKRIEEIYVQSARKVEEIGLPNWPQQIVHGDWHPGNMLFRDRHIVAVIDYDAARVQQRVIDFANGVLQFSILGGGDDPTKWPEYVDVTRFKRFMLGYDSVNVITKHEMQCVPHLMCEAMIAEGVLPIAATGSFGRIQGYPFLKMIDRKVRWIQENVEALSSVLDD